MTLYNDMNSKRIDYIDVAKALLILCLLYGHMFMVAKFQGHSDIIRNECAGFVKIYATFFMQTFFLITGLCSSFKRPFVQYLKNNTKTILVPGITLVVLCRYLYNICPGEPFSHTPSATEWLVTGGPWFIFALFEAKLLYWVINKFNYKMQLLIVTSIAYIGILLAQFKLTDNYVWYQHSLIMLPYLCLGNIAKSYIERIMEYLPRLAIVGVIILLVEFIFDIPMPYLDYNIGVSLKSSLLHILNVMSGSFLILWVAKIIGSNSFLQTLGKGTLLIYLLNECVLKAIIQLQGYIYCPAFESKLIPCIVLYITTYAIAVVFFYYLIKVVYESSYLRWIVGKY